MIIEAYWVSDARMGAFSEISVEASNADTSCV
jgi:hypothetical protein